MKVLPISEFVDFSIRASIVIATFRDCPSPLTLENAVTLRDQRLAFQDNTPYPVLIISPRSMIRFEKKAVKYLSGEEGMKDITAGAILVRSWALMKIARLFMKKNKNPPTKIFFKRRDAIAWLKEQCNLTGTAIDAFQIEDPYPTMSKKKKKILRNPTAKTSAKSGSLPTENEPFTDREKEIVELIGRGLSSQQIADQLFIDKRTVDKHRQHINDKIGVNSVAGFFRWLLDNKKNTA